MKVETIHMGYNPTRVTHFLSKVETVASEDFTVQGGKLPGLDVNTLGLSLPLTSFCLEHGIQVCITTRHLIITREIVRVIMVHHPSCLVRYFPIDTYH